MPVTPRRGIVHMARETTVNYVRYQRSAPGASVSCMLGGPLKDNAHYLIGMQASGRVRATGHHTTRRVLCYRVRCRIRRLAA